MSLRRKLKRPRARVIEADWQPWPCPGCERLVWFLPGQEDNTCGWCGRAVRRGME